MDISKIYQQLKGMMRANAGAELAFGTASRVGDSYIVPVARVSFAFGLGGGISQKKPQKTAKEEPASEEPCGQAEPKTDEGFGGGGNIKTDPIGLYLISGEKLRYLPVISMKELFTAGAFICLLLFRIQRLKRKK